MALQSKSQPLLAFVVGVRAPGKAALAITNNRQALYILITKQYAMLSVIAWSHAQRTNTNGKKSQQTSGFRRKTCFSNKDLIAKTPLRQEFKKYAGTVLY